MKCHDAERLLSAERDGPIPPPEAASLTVHLKGCASCRRLQADLAEGYRRWSAESAERPVPDAQAAWRELRATLHAREERGSSRAWMRWLSFGIPLAATAAVAFLFVRPAIVGPVGTGSLARVEYVEPGTPGASTLVYEDLESGWLVIWTADAETAKGL